MSNFAIVILAAGNSSRMGSPKQLLDYGGQPLVRHAVTQAAAAGAAAVIVVTGAYLREIADALAGTRATVVHNPRWSEGMGTSIQAGLAAVPPEAAGAILTLADQPLLTAAIYQRLIALHHETRQPIVTAEYAGTVGVPVLFTRDYFAHLNALPPSQGCKGVILQHSAAAVRMACPEAEADVDTQADYARLCGPSAG